MGQLGSENSPGFPIRGREGIAAACDALSDTRLASSQDAEIERSWHAEVNVITGTIASGKSSVAEALQKRGAFVVSADVLAHKALEKGSEGYTSVIAEFGTGILGVADEIDRKKLGSIIFTQPDKRRALESIVHPLVAKQAERLFVEAIACRRRPLVYEVPLFFEAGLAPLGFKQIIVVAASDDVCVSRLMKRNGLTEDEARQRIQAQWPAAEKKRLADIVIDNSAGLEALDKQIDAVLPLL